MLLSLLHYLPLLLIGVLILFAILKILGMRIVVPTNDIHIVQSGRKTISYGKDQPAGNVYYQWPAHMPLLGVEVSELPVSVFSQTLTDYNAYDKGRVPFMLDVIGFFRITDSNVAAQRISDMDDLEHQLDFILKGSIRSILAGSDIEQILEGRSEFSHQFTEAVDAQLGEWGLKTVKALEIMDIRDVQGSKVIDNIMNKQKSRIEMESRTQVAQNMKAAQEAEIAAQQAVEIAKQVADEQVGVRTAEKAQTVGIREQQAQQAIQEQAKETNIKEMAVLEVQQVRAADIARQAAEVAAEQAKNVAIKKSEGDAQTRINIAQGDLEAATRAAQGRVAIGEAEGRAQEAVLLAPVNAQIALAREIGTNDKYQHYLLSIKQIDATQAIGIEQAKALEKASVKVIATAGTPMEGLRSVAELATPKGGLSIAAALEALGESDVGRAVIDRVVGSPRPNGGGGAAG